MWKPSRERRECCARCGCIQAVFDVIVHCWTFLLRHKKKPAEAGAGLFGISNPGRTVPLPFAWLKVEIIGFRLGDVSGQIRFDKAPALQHVCRGVAEGVLHLFATIGDGIASNVNISTAGSVWNAAQSVINLIAIAGRKKSATNSPEGDTSAWRVCRCSVNPK